MKPIIIVGAGGFGREVQYLIETINEKKPTWEILGYVDDGKPYGTEINGYQVLGNLDYLASYDASVSVVVSIGSPKVRRKVVEKLKVNSCLQFPNIVDSNVQISEYVELGEGNIICAGNVITTNIKFGDFNIINLSCTVGHDVNLNSYITIYPGVNISGNVSVATGCEIGTGSQIIQGLVICQDCIIGAGTVVVENIEEKGTYIGVPARKIH